MTLSPPSLLKKFALPYALLLTLYVVVVGAGTSTLLHQARQTQADNIIHNLQSQLEPVVKDLRNVDINPFDWLGQKDGQASNGVKFLYDTFPTLRQVFVQNRESSFGWQKMKMAGSETPGLEMFEPPPLDNFLNDSRSPSRRLYDDRDPLFLVNFPLTDNTDDPLQSAFGFTRADLLIAIENELDPLRNVIGLFGAVGFISIVIAFVVSIYMAGTVRKTEAQLQTLYRHSNLATLAARLVHDVRNRMHSIRVNVKNVLITPSDTPQVVDEIDDDIVHLEKILAQFLDTARLRDESFEIIDIAKPLMTAARMIKPKLQQHQITLQTDIPDGLQTAVMTQSLAGAVLDLLTNACEASPPGNSIWLSAAKKRKRKRNWIVISVEDAGEGIDDEVREHLLEPFVTTKSEGHGLGLANVSDVIDAHNGRIEVTDRAGGGACFSLFLPIKNKLKLAKGKKSLRNVEKPHDE